MKRMLSPDSLLLEELKCPICLEELVDPVTAGSCNHPYCRNCLKKYVEEKARGNEFNCPLCQQTCTLPQNGIAGLQRIVVLANVIEKYADVRKGLNQSFKCSYCTDANKNVRASLACLQCDDISLCRDCGLDHVSDPHTESHEVTALCELHGKPLKMFCKRCGKAICVVCLGKHSKKEGHEQDDVKGYRDVVETSKAELGLDAEAAGGATQQVEKHIAELKQVRSKRKELKDTSEKAATKRFDENASRTDDNIIRLATEIEFHRAELDRKVKEKRSKECTKESILNEKKEFIGTLESKYNHDTEAIDDIIEDLVDIRCGISDAVRQSKTFISDKILRAELHDDIKQTQAKLKDLTSDARTDRITLLKDRLRTGEGLREEYVAAAGKLSSASRSYALTVPEGENIFHSVSYMSRDRIAASVSSAKSYKLLLWNLPSLKCEEYIMQDRVCIPYIAALGQDTLVVLRRASPILKVINVVKKRERTRDIDVKLPKEAVDHLSSVEVVSHGNFLVSYGEKSEMHIVLVNGKGIVLHMIDSKTCSPTFCRITGLITSCNNNGKDISCYRLDDNTLSEVMSAPHYVEGFSCTDICSSSLGEIFIVGIMKGDAPREIRIYQLIIDTGKKTVSMKRIEIKDVKLTNRSEYSSPKFSVHGNCLVIGCDSTVQVLKLSVDENLGLSQYCTVQ